MGERPPSPPLLAVRHLGVSVRVAGRELSAVDDVSFEILPGRTLGIVGESGSGKSLAARAIMGLLPASVRVTSGEIRFEGVDLRPLPDREMRRRRGAGLAMIFQDPLRSLDPTMRVGDQIGEAIRAHRSCGRAETGTRRSRCSMRCACRRRGSDWTTTRTSFPAGCASG